MSPDRQSSILQALHQTGEYYHEKGDAESAERQLKQALELSPDHTPSRLLLASVFVGTGRLDEGLAELEGAYASDKEVACEPLVALLLDKGKQLDSVNDEEGALAAYQRVTEISADDLDAPQRVSAIWRKRGEEAVVAGDLDRAIAAYSEAGLGDQVDRVKELKRQKGIDRDATAARSHEEKEEWQEACVTYERLIADDPGNGEWKTALEQAQVELDLAKRYTEGCRCLDSAAWKPATDAFLEVLIVRADYKDAAMRLAQAVGKRSGTTAEKAQTAEKQDPTPSPRSDEVREPDGERSEPNEGPSDGSVAFSRAAGSEHSTALEPVGRKREYPGGVAIARLLVVATVASLLATLVVVYLLTVPLDWSILTPGEVFGLLTSGEWGTASEGLLSLLVEDRMIPRAPVTIFVVLILAALSGWLASARKLDDGRVLYQGGEEWTPAGSVQPSLLGQVQSPPIPRRPAPRRDAPKKANPENNGVPATARKPSSRAKEDASEASRASSDVASDNPGNPDQIPARDLSDEELKSKTLSLAEEVRSFGDLWERAASEAAAYPPPKTEDSVQLYVDLIEKLGGFQQDFDSKYRKQVSEICDSVRQRVVTEEEADEDDILREPDDVEDAVSQLEQMAALL